MRERRGGGVGGGPPSLPLNTETQHTLQGTRCTASDYGVVLAATDPIEIIVTLHPSPSFN